MALRTLLTDPRTFFARRQDDPSLAGPALVVALHALLVLIATAFILRAFSGVVGQIDTEQIVYAAGDRRVSAPWQLVASLWATAALYFGLWIVVSVIVHLASTYYDGTGPFRRVLAFVGWSLAPTLVPTAATTAVAIATFAGAPTFESETAAVQWIEANVSTDALHLGVEAVRPLFTLWMAYLWVLAAEYGRELTRRQALVCVALPGGIAALNALGTFAGVVARLLGLTP